MGHVNLDGELYAFNKRFQMLNNQLARFMATCPFKTLKLIIQWTIVSVNAEVILN